MWRRIHSRLALRIFLITAALLAAACALTYGMLAYLTPISYTAMVEDELDAAAEELLARLEQTTYAESDGELARFSRETGATARVILTEDFDFDATAEGTSVEAEDFTRSVEAVATEVQIALTSREDDVIASAAMEGTSLARGAVDEISIAGDAASAELCYDFAFRDGQAAMLAVGSGLRAVNRTAEAMRRVLPYLALAMLAFSLLAALAYARFIARPIEEIGQIAGRIARQDFGARWRGRRRDEIGELGESLNRVSDSLSGALGELQSANARLRADIEREREIERQRLAFFSATSHELKTPVTILKGQLSGMLARVGAYRDREKYLARALEVAGRMEGLIQQILTVSRLETTSAAGEETVNLSELIERQIAQDAELIEARGMRLTAQIAPDVTLRGSEKLLSSAIDNVLMNAALYSPPGAEIRVSLTREKLLVFNGGAKIDESDLARLFEPFYRVEQSRNRASGGSGLGLYLVKRIFAMHGVECAIKNTPEGVLFEAMLPRDESYQANSAAGSEHRSASPSK